VSGKYLIVDIATTPLELAQDFIEDNDAPGNYTKPESIAAWKAKDRQKQIEEAAIDPDLGRISAIGYMAVSTKGGAAGEPAIPCHLDEDDERATLAYLAETFLNPSDGWTLIGFNSLRFDWPFMVRRAQYLGVDLDISIDTYKTRHIDLYDRLTNHGKLSGHSLGFYVKRHGWNDLSKPLSGGEEAKAPQKGLWAELEASVRHDVIATHRLAQWLKVL
jgi:hypothetical protein